MHMPLAHPHLSEAATEFLARKHQAFIGGKWVDAVGQDLRHLRSRLRTGDRPSGRMRRGRFDMRSPPRAWLSRAGLEPHDGKRPREMMWRLADLIEQHAAELPSWNR